MSVLKREQLPLKNSNDVVLARQKVRQWAIELRFSLVDQTKLVTAASELARNALDHGKGGQMTIESLVNGRKVRVAADLRRSGSGHSRYRAGTERRIHDRLRHGAGPRRQQTPCERIQHRIRSRQGHKDHRRAMEIVFTEWVPVTRCQFRWRSAAHGYYRRPSGWGSTRPDPGNSACWLPKHRATFWSTAEAARWSLLAISRTTAQWRAILAIDKGAGIANIAEAMSDGYSTAGTMGGGLGAMKRIATRLEIFTGRGGHRSSCSSLESRAPNRNRSRSCRRWPYPYPGERVCGDAWFSHQTPNARWFCWPMGSVMDGERPRPRKKRLPHFGNGQTCRPARFWLYPRCAAENARSGCGDCGDPSRRERLLIYAGVGNISGVVLEQSAPRAAWFRTMARWE